VLFERCACSAQPKLSSQRTWRMRRYDCLVGDGNPQCKREWVADSSAMYSTAGEAADIRVRARPRDGRVRATNASLRWSGGHCPHTGVYQASVLWSDHSRVRRQLRFLVAVVGIRVTALVRGGRTWDGHWSSRGTLGFAAAWIDVRRWRRRRWRRRRGCDCSNARVRSATTLTRLRFVRLRCRVMVSRRSVAVGWLAPRVTGVARVQPPRRCQRGYAGHDAVFALVFVLVLVFVVDKNSCGLS